MNITLENISKRFGRQWVLKDLSFQFLSGEKYAIVGHNGAGKSTLLNIIIGKIPYSKGSIYYSLNGRRIKEDEVYRHVSIATTAMSLIEEFTLEEHLKFHFRFRDCINNYSLIEVLSLMELSQESNKRIHNFSSGMKQRLKIALAIFSESDLIVLDEPGANLDEQSKTWFQNLLQSHRNDRTLIIASNDTEDILSCDHSLDLT